MRVLVLFLLALAAASAANVRLYLKDGAYQTVREYEVKGDRVRFYSVDRREWEEIPLVLIDLPRTEKEVAEKAATQAAIVQEEQAEDAAIKAERTLVRNVPDTTGVYRVEGQKLIPLTEITAFKRDSTTNRILQIVVPMPNIPGKTTVFVEGKAAKYRITDPSPEFFFRLAQPESLAIVKLDVKKGERIVEEVMVLPLGEGNEELRKPMPTFKKQYEPNLYRVWTEKPLEPGEYAVIEYTEGEIAVRVWDFAIDKKK